MQYYFLTFVPIGVRVYMFMYARTRLSVCEVLFCVYICFYVCSFLGWCGTFHVLIAYQLYAIVALCYAYKLYAMHTKCRFK